MDLTQTKLSKSEWVSVEIPVSDQEKSVLSLILNGYRNPDIKTNRHLSLLSFMKVEASEEMEYFLYTTHFVPLLEATKSDIWKAFYKPSKDKKKKTPGKADMIRIQNLETQIVTQRNSIFDFVLLDYAVQALGSASASSLVKAVYTLLKFRKLSINGVNRFLLAFVDHLLKSVDTTSPSAIHSIVHNAQPYIEKNAALMKYDDDALYTHQRDLFRLFSNPANRTTPKCVLYMAPTGTGKTLSPIGISEQYRVLFVCAARHVGLALAKSAISVGKRVAFAFGCETAADIRLHYFAAADYTINKKSGGIYKVDNSNGSRVEIMICDVASYLVAMYYMKCFHSVNEMVTYWDEPTIGMDKHLCDPKQRDPKPLTGEPEEHLDENLKNESSELHHLIHRVWSLNQIPNVVLSCATLPKPDEIGPALQDFKAKFAEIDGEAKDPEIHVIDSHDCKKTISLIGKDGRIALPHLLFPDYHTLITECLEHCETNKSILRYFDVQEIVRFVEHIQPILREGAKTHHYFKSIDALTLHSLKQYYLYVLREIPADQWPVIYQYMTESLMPRFQGALAGSDIRKIKSEAIIPRTPSASGLISADRASKPIVRQASVSQIPPTPTPTPNPKTASSSAASGILLTTSDAHTLTDGPTIYLAEDVEKVGRFYLQQSKIPDTVFSSIQQKIEKNNQCLKQIKKIEQEVELKTATPLGDKASKKAEKEPASKEVQRMLEQIKGLREAMQTVHLSSIYIPNTKPHLELWTREPTVPFETLPSREPGLLRSAFETLPSREPGLLRSAFETLPSREPGLLRSAFETLPYNNGLSKVTKNGFCKGTPFPPNVDEEDVREIMSLDVDNQQKLLLILGIGVFSKSTDKQYAEIMKRLAYEQRLYLIIASSDYIYGTNYQFCHGFIGKDLANMTQQKTIQAIGRIGRNNIQQEYTVRFRDDDVLQQLFKRPTENLEAETMNRLFCSDE